MYLTCVCRREFDGFNKRLLELEHAVFSELTYKASDPNNAGGSRSNGRSFNAPEPWFESVTTLNTSTCSVEFYGSTSILALARFLGNRLREFEGEHHIHEPPSKKPVPAMKTSSLELDGLFEHNDFIPIPWQPQTRRWKLREDVANAHVRSFFDTIHDFLPVLDVDSFMSAYRAFWDAPPLDTESLASQQRQCLVYSVLAMGALKSDSGSNNAEWAASYFSEAQEVLGKLFDAVSIETVQAALFMVFYRPSPQFQGSAN